MLIYSFYDLIQGHNNPGGGFIAGLVAAAAFSLFAFSEGVSTAKKLLRVNPRNIAAFGLLVSVCSIIYPLFLGDAPMTGKWTSFAVPVIGKLGTPLFFDVGVYFVVIGITLTIVYSLMED